MIKAGSDYDAICAQFEWPSLEKFNMGVAVSDKWANEAPQRTALLQWDGQQISRKITYGELKTRSDALASGLRKLGMKPGERLAIILPQSLETALAHIAVYKNGAIAVPLARLFQPEALQFRLERAGCSHVITDEKGYEKLKTLEGKLEGIKNIIVVNRENAASSAKSWQVHDFEEVAAQGAAEIASTGFQAAETTPDDPALIIFTSGTTGPPKGALHGHRVLIGHVPSVIIEHEFMPQPGDIGWTPADWAWAGGLLNLLMPCLYLGVPVVFGGLDRFDAGKAFFLLEKTGATCSFIPPTALRLMKAVEGGAKRFNHSLRTISSGGESLGADTWSWAKNELGITVNELYGQTECNLVLGSCGKLGVTREGAIGKATPGHQVAVLDSKGNICKPGETGELGIKAPDPVMFLGYWQDDEATANKYRDGWMMTGDQCMVDEDGYFHFVGRDDDIINSAGYRVGPGEIEDCLVSHPSILLAAAVGKPDPLRTEVVKAYVVVTPEVQQTMSAHGGEKYTEALRDELMAHVKARLAANIYPREIEFVDEIPLTTTGKVIRRVFRERARQEAEREAGSGK